MIVDNVKEYVADAAKLSPPVTVVGSHLAGVNWSDVAYILTSIYTAVLIAQHLWFKWIKPWYDKRGGKDAD